MRPVVPIPSLMLSDIAYSPVHDGSSGFVPGVAAALRFRACSTAVTLRGGAGGRGGAVRLGGHRRAVCRRVRSIDMEGVRVRPADERPAVPARAIGGRRLRRGWSASQGGDACSVSHRPGARRLRACCHERRAVEVQRGNGGQKMEVVRQGARGARAAAARSAGARRARQRLPAPGSRLPAPGSRLRLPAPGSRLPAPGSRLPAPGSRLPAPGSRLPAPGSRLPTQFYLFLQLFALLMRSAMGPFHAGVRESPSPPGRGVWGEGRVGIGLPVAKFLDISPSPPAPLPVGESRPIPCPASVK